MVLVDAGPLIALVHADDQHHGRCVAAFQELTEPLGTVWPVLTEAMYLFSFSWKAQDALWEMLDRGVIRVLSLADEDVSRMRVLMKKYKDLPMDLADAALVAVAERERIRPSSPSTAGTSVSIVQPSWAGLSSCRASRVTAVGYRLSFSPVISLRKAGKLRRQYDSQAE